jgi:hypothetical protein
MCVYVYVYYVYVHVSMCVCMCMYVCICMYVHVCMCMHVSAHKITFVRIQSFLRLQSLSVLLLLLLLAPAAQTIVPSDTYTKRTGAPLSYTKYWMWARVHHHRTDSGAIVHAGSRWARRCRKIYEPRRDSGGSLSLSGSLAPEGSRSRSPARCSSLSPAQPLSERGFEPQEQKKAWSPQPKTGERASL